ncbi:MAG: phosphoribosylglycinamide formyltransferase [Paludibacteraceae bacterium]|nr:phosphoribosylglycinamide formyltransferase [Paludibacteraceae bacterium]MBN2787887.1 phosphoribosylglycinamide formyltransferase [Paludibacteraceae bacterium]
MSLKIAIFASGSGSNAENLIHYFKQSKHVNIVLILSNKPDAFVHKRAKKLHIPSISFTKNQFSESDYILKLLQEKKIDLIILAGFLLKVPTNLIHAYPNRIINIHPALLPKYGGKGMYGQYVHEAVVAHNEKETGITIHYVNEHYDEGTIIFQAKCAVLPTDTADDVAKRVHQLEYEHFPKVVEKFIQEKLNNKNP